MTYSLPKISKGFALFVFLFILSGSLKAATYTWQGGASGSWTVTANWNGGVPASSNTSTVLFPSGGSYAVSAVPTVLLGKIDVQGSVSLTPATTNTISLGSVTTAGNLTIATSQILTIGSGLTIAYAGSGTTPVLSNSGTIFSR